MTKDSPRTSGGSRMTSKKPGSSVPTAAVLEEQKRELEKLRAELEAERMRGREERRRFSAQTRQLREAAEQERQQLVDHLRSKWEAQRGRDMRQLQEDMLREREAEIRQLLRWKEAEHRQLQQLLHCERDGVLRQARELQRQLAEELVSRGYCGRAGVPEVAAAQCRCRLQEVLAQLRWETDGEQASRIRHLQAALDLERQLFLKYILEHFRWPPALPNSRQSQTVHSSEEPHPKTTGDPCDLSKSACLLESLDNLSPGVRMRSRSLDVMPEARSSATDSLLHTRASSLVSLAPARSCSLDRTLSRIKPPESKDQVPSSPDTTILGSPSSLPPPSPPAPERRRPSDTREDSSSQPCETLVPSPIGLDYHELLRQNSELSELLQVLARRYTGLQKENIQLRRAGFPEEAEKVKLLKGKHAELTNLARRIEDRARKLQDTNLRAVSSLIQDKSSASLDLCQIFACQRARDLSEQASVLLAKDKQIEELRQECHLLQVRIASGQDSWQPGDAATRVQWLNVNDLDVLQRKSQWEVLRLQRQLALQQGNNVQGEAGGQSTPFEEALRQVQALELELVAQRHKCEKLDAKAVGAARRCEEAEAQLQAALQEGSWQAKENVRLQAQVEWMWKIAAENNDLRGQLDRTCQERDSASLLTEQLLQQAALGQDRQQQLQQALQKALSDLQTAQEEIQALQHRPHYPTKEAREVVQALKSQGLGSQMANFLPRAEDQAPSQPNRQEKEEASLPELPSLVELTSGPQMPDRVPVSQSLGSRPQSKKTNSESDFSSEVESMWATVPSCPALDMDTASEVEDLEPDSVSSTLEVEDSEVPTSPKLKIFLARYSYNPFEGPNKHPESELPLIAGDYVYVFGDMDEDGFYEGELEDGQRGLVPSNLVEQIPESDVLGSLSPNVPDLDLAQLSVGQGIASKEDIDYSLLPGEAQRAVYKGPCQMMVRAVSKTEMTIESSDAKSEAYQLDLVQILEEQGFSRSFLGVKELYCVVPKQIHLQSIATTSAEITWLYGSSNYPHVVYLNGQEHAVVPAGVSCYTFHYLHPGMQYQVQVEVKLPWDLIEVYREVMSSTITFTTPMAGPPDPPLDVLVERHASTELLMVSWLPVTIDSAGSSNGVQVTGYAVYADGLKVAEVFDATAGSTVLEFSQLQRLLMCQKVSVRTMSLYGESVDSVPAQIPQDCATCYQLPNTSSFSSTYDDPCTCRVAFPVCPQRLGMAPLSVKATLPTRSHGEPQDEFPETFPKESPGRRSLVPNLSSEDCPSVESGTQIWESPELREICRKDLFSQKSSQSHKPPELGGQSGWEEDLFWYMDSSKNHIPRVVHPSFSDCGSRKKTCQEKTALEKTLRRK